MKRIIQLLVTGIFIGTSSIAFSQQETMFTQYMFNEVVINPGYTGSHGMLSMTGVVREQWLGLEGAPSTQSFTIHKPLRAGRMGGGLSIINDQIGISGNTSIYLSASYKLLLRKNATLQFGLQGGVTNNRTDLNSLNVEDNSEEIFNEGNVSRFLPNIGAGLYFFTKKFYLGFSIPQLVNNSLSIGNSRYAVQERHYFVTTGYVFDLSKNWKYKPSLFYKYVYGAPMEIDITNTFIIKDKFWFGLAWRSMGSSDFILGLQITEKISISYSYDYALTDLRQFNTGSHEFIVNYRFSSSKKIMTPRYF
ncbi:MAG: type IX secretion system membrane protein PorP/SprF [Cytophagales bacterium]|nr:type IX secretion system membrane protein PorP/SprF [Cytophagales bacterium]